jgi:alpha-amylase
MADGNEQKTPTAENMTMMQGFEWYVPADQKHWVRLEKHVPELKKWGVDNIWIPPACKGSSPNGNGYDIYDLYDLGEFDKNGSVATKWGTKEELLKLADTATKSGVGLYFDAVLNHKFSADRVEKCRAIEVDANDRTRDISEEHEIEAWVGFTFPGRGDKYSSMKWHWYHFTGVDWDAKSEKSGIFRIVGDKTKGWADVGDVDHEKGN